MRDELTEAILNDSRKCVRMLQNEANKHRGDIPDYVAGAIAGTCSLALNTYDHMVSIDLLVSVMKCLYKAGYVAGYVAGSENPLRNIGRG